jgi:hypothetical protein
MSQRTAIERARLDRGRYVWFARIPFVIAAVTGGAAIVAMKYYGIDQAPVTLIACALIILYALLVNSIAILRVREDQLADNCYYLGFLYTLTSLSWALYDFGRNDDVNAIVANFGIALGSTIVGIVLRVFLNQARRDVLETERDARMELSDAVARMRVQLDDAVLALGSFCRVAQQSAAEQINAVATESTKVLHEGVGKVAEASSRVMERIDQAFAEFGEHAETLNKTAAATVKSVKALLTRIEKIEAPNDLLKARLEPALATVDRAANLLSDRLAEDERLMQAYGNRVSALQEELETGTERLKASLAELRTIGDAAAGASTTTKEAVAKLTGLVQSASASVKDQAEAVEAMRSEASRLAQILLDDQRKLGESARDGVERLATDLRTHNEQLALELERARRLIDQTSHALIGLANYVTERVAEPSS